MLQMREIDMMELRRYKKVRQYCVLDTIRFVALAMYKLSKLSNASRRKSKLATLILRRRARSVSQARDWQSLLTTKSGEQTCLNAYKCIHDINNVVPSGC